MDGKGLHGTLATGETTGLHLLALQQSEENLVVKQTALKEMAESKNAPCGLGSRFADHVDWPSLSQVFVLHREVIGCRTVKRSQHITYGITSVPPCSGRSTSVR